jgi:hypothetical protein
MTSPHISIHFDENTCIASIQGYEVTDNSWLRIKLLIQSSDSEDIRIRSDQLIELPWSALHRCLNQLAYLLKEEGIATDYDNRSRQLIQDHLRDVESLSQDHICEITDEQIEEMLNRSGFRRKLKKEQIRDLRTLQSIRHGANFSVPGSGKTTTLLALHSLLKCNSVVDRLLVISPRNAFISWEDEVLECFDKSPIRIVRLTGGRENIRNLIGDDPDICLITYQQLPIVIDDVESGAKLILPCS